MNVNREYVKYHLRLLFLFIGYLFMEILTNFVVGTPAFVRAIIVAAFLLVEQAFRPVDFFRSPKLIFVLKYIFTLVLASFIVNRNLQNYEYVMFSIMYFVAMLELSTYFDLSETEGLVVFNILAIIPLVFFGFAYVFAKEDYKYVLIYTLEVSIIAIMIFAITKFYGVRTSYFSKTILSKERMIEKAMDINKLNTEKQEKLFYVNEQLGTKRIELEEANRKNRVINDEISLQNDILKFFGSSNDLVKYTEYMSNRLISDFHVKCAGILKLNDAGAMSVFEDYKKCNSKYNLEESYRIYGDTDDALNQVFVKEFVNDKFIDEVLKDELLICSNIRRLGYTNFAENKINSFVLKTIVVDGRKAFIYMIAHSDPNYFEDKKEFIEILVNQLQVALNNGFIYLQYEDRAIHDGLTGLYNRRILNKTIEKYRHSDSIIKQEHIAALMIDIDNFKRVNDTYGHVFGDSVLVELASIIRSSVDDYEGIPFRYGGEEFVVLFIDKSLDEVVEAAKSILENVRHRDISYEGVTINITVSIGISAYPYTCNDQSHVIDDADKALYISKTTGKDKYTVEHNND